MILATKGGWLIACTVVRETPRGKYITYNDEKNPQERYVRNADKRAKLFDDVNKATDWINEGRPCK